jgi:Mrp family chromosome partitioning ATPase
MSKNFELLQQTSHEQDLFHTGGHVVVQIEPQEKKPTNGEKPANGTAKGISFPMRWPDFIREKANQWRQEIQRQADFRPADGSGIALAEEVKLIQRIFPRGDRSARRIVLFSGIDEEAGCSSVCDRASAVLAAQDEGSVCVVDAAVRAPYLHRSFGVENTQGWTEAVADSRPIQEFAQRVSNRGLWIIPSGLGNLQSNALVSYERLQARVAELRGCFKYVLIHSSPINMDPGAILLSQLTDGVVLVLEANTTRRERARGAKECLEAAGAHILGVVLNNRTFPIPEALYRRI